MLIFLIGRQKNLFNPVVALSTTFRNVSRLSVGNIVRFSGINVGSVGNIEREERKNSIENAKEEEETRDQKR